MRVSYTRISEEGSKGKEGRKKIGETRWYSCERALPQPLVSLFLPSFLPSAVRYETTRCIFPLVITCTFYYLVFVSPPYTAGSLILPLQSPLPQYPVPMAYYTGAHASLTLPHTPTIPLSRHHFHRPPPPSLPSISAGLKSKLLEIGSGRHRSPPIPQGNT